MHANSSSLSLICDIIFTDCLLRLAPVAIYFWLCMTTMRHIRTAARALIILEQQVLAIKMRDRTGVFYILPGGGQRHGETLREGLERECLEEIGTHVEVGELLYVREYIGKNHEFRNSHHAFHQVENVFRCALPDPDGIGPRHGARQKTSRRRVDPAC